MAACFLSAGLVDEVYLFMAPVFLGGKNALTSIEGTGWATPGDGVRMTNAKITRLGEDWLMHGFLVTGHPPHPAHWATFPQEGKENRDFPSPLGRPFAELTAPGAAEPLLRGQGEGSGQLRFLR